MSDDFNSILSRMLERVPSTRDKRVSSIIYDALAPIAAELAQMYIVKSIFEEQTGLLTAHGKSLERIAANFGIKRKEATHAIRIAATLGRDGNPIDMPVGSRFATPNMTSRVNYTITGYYETTGMCLITAETTGAIGNAHIGQILPLDFAANNLGSAAITGTYRPAEDEETDEELRSRTIERINQKAFGGNTADYKQFTKNIDGVGDVKVFPAWAGGGSTMLSIIDSEYNIATAEFIDTVQTAVDPILNTGLGLGIAPIGHRVTVVTPTAIPITVSAHVDLKPGYTIAQLQASIDSAVSSYLLDLRRDWANASSVSVFTARIGAVVISVEGVNNVTGITINGEALDLLLTQTPELQQLPVFGSVVLSGG